MAYLDFLVVSKSYLNVLSGLKAVELIEQLEHSPLHLRVAARARLDSSRADAVNFVHEDDGGCMLPGEGQADA